MKKKVLPPFHHHYTAAEELLISVCKKHFISLKLKGEVIIPFAWKLDANEKVIAIQPDVFTEKPALPFIEQFWQSGEAAVKAKEIVCFAVCYDAHVFDEDAIDQDALVLMLKKEDGSQQQINVPYVMAADSLVYGESWLSGTT